ncbi:helix-turn-helix domain-containing protein [Paenibacillus thalictri]|uniref:XRE family transcriptional regulator n=1 Tax=Paenibacillus thalictri TaxID=2527873 RepID=A0A4Q9DFS1_9BACL|nr:helix-turn-helix transcriptional regulator [Paenibacillus thalictri]TBL70854.1 XRE family transcriptional regulator [Paenibacillus thalictri]
MQFSSRILQLREQRQLTQKELAHAIGISRATLSHYENNRRQPDLDTLNKIAEYFEVSVDYLVGMSEDVCKQGEFTVSKDGLHSHHIIHFRHAVFPSRLL